MRAGLREAARGVAVRPLAVLAVAVLIRPETAAAAAPPCRFDVKADGGQRTVEVVAEEGRPASARVPREDLRAPVVEANPCRERPPLSPRSGRAGEAPAAKAEADEPVPAGEALPQPTATAPSRSRPRRRPPSLRGFPVPPFLLPIYQSAAAAHGVPWEVLAAINDVETDYGRNVAVSSAGARGWMQFMPATWRQYGVDADGDGRRDPDSPVDAIFAAARYLQASGAATDLDRAIFAYNHADWYVRMVRERAAALGLYPAGIPEGLAGLVAVRFAVRGGDPRPAGVGATAQPGAAVVAPVDAVVRRVTRRSRHGMSIELADRDGRRYRFSHLGSLARLNPSRRRRPAARVRPRRLFAHPTRPRAWAAGGREQVRPPGAGRYVARFSVLAGLPREELRVRPLRRGSRVRAGTILGRVGTASRRWRRRTHVRVDVRPAGRRAPWLRGGPVMLASYRLETARWFERERPEPGLGGLLALTDGQLRARVLHDRRIAVYACGRSDIRLGRTDRRVLVTLLHLAEIGMHPTVTSLQCGHSYLTASGNVSHHSTGTAVDIAAINGVPILGHQGPGSITEAASRRLLELPGAMRPAQVISLMQFRAPNSLALSDHHDHIHVGWSPGPAPKPALVPVGGQPPRRLDPVSWPAVWPSLPG